ncbi:SUMF1/EgtB/PvdO family nonheme iron enzyme [Thalassotalea fusca]
MKITKLLIAMSIATSSVSYAINKPIEPVMVQIPAGSFKMGSTSRANAQPIHTVNIQSFGMSKYEVTVAEFRRFVEMTNYPVPQTCRHELDVWFLLPSKGNWETNRLNTSEHQPVVCINWQAANAYAQWLAKETGRPYRLPSEAEWEYAARAGTKTDYYFGDDKDNTLVCDYENTGDRRGESILQLNNNTSYYNWTGEVANCEDNSGYASIVGMYKPNPFGLHDMVSNVVEFLSDCYVGTYEGAPTDGSARIDGKCDRRVVRGSSWHWSHFPLANRRSTDEIFSGGVNGFRLVIDNQIPPISNETRQFILSLEFAQQQAQKRRDLLPEIPAPVKNLQISQNSNSVRLTWDNDQHDHTVSYRVYRNALPGKMFKMIANNIDEMQFIDGNVPAHAYDYTVVAVRRHTQSTYAPPVTKAASWVKLPAQVEAEWATKITDTKNNTGISFTSDKSRRIGYNLTGAVGIGEGAEMSYQIEVPKSGAYQLSYRVASPRNTLGFEIYNESKKLTVQKIDATGGYHDWKTQNGGTIHLEKGKHTITLRSLDNDWKLNWFSIEQS